MTIKELETETMLANIPAEQMAAFLQRGQLLTAAAEMDSKIRNVQAERDAAAVTFQKEIEDLQAARNELQKQIDAL